MGAKESIVGEVVKWTRSVRVSSLKNAAMYGLLYSVIYQRCWSFILFLS
jgi:hypothetical protein